MGDEFYPREFEFLVDGCVSGPDRKPLDSFLVSRTCLSGAHAETHMPVVDEGGGGFLGLEGELPRTRKGRINVDRFELVSCMVSTISSLWGGRGEFDPWHHGAWV